MPDETSSLDDLQSVKIQIINPVNWLIILRSSRDAELMLVSSLEIVNNVSIIGAVCEWNLNFF